LLSFQIAWGICLACHAAAYNFATLMVVRFLLGWFEAAVRLPIPFPGLPYPVTSSDGGVYLGIIFKVQPSFLILTSTWYRREEQSETLSYWYSCNGLQQAVLLFRSIAVLFPLETSR
jgi:hypothetical protein